MGKGREGHLTNETRYGGEKQTLLLLTGEGSKGGKKQDETWKSFDVRQVQQKKGSTCDTLTRMRRHVLHTSSMISRLREMGFSQKIIFPALAAAMICPACWSVGEQITTASTSASLMSCAIMVDGHGAAEKQKMMITDTTIGGA